MPWLLASPGHQQPWYWFKGVDELSSNCEPKTYLCYVMFFSLKYLWTWQKNARISTGIQCWAQPNTYNSMSNRTKYNAHINKIYLLHMCTVQFWLVSRRHYLKMCIKTRFEPKKKNQIIPYQSFMGYLHLNWGFIWKYLICVTQKPYCSKRFSVHETSMSISTCMLHIDSYQNLRSAPC